MTLYDSEKLWVKFYIIAIIFLVSSAPFCNYFNLDIEVFTSIPQRRLNLCGMLFIVGPSIRLRWGRLRNGLPQAVRAERATREGKSSLRGE